MAKHRISFQLYSARNFLPLEPVLEDVAKIGYDAVEPFYPLYGEDPAGYRRKVDAVGLKTPTFHAPMDGVVGETARFIDIAKTIGAETIVIPYLGAEARPTTVDGWKKLHDDMAATAKKVNAAGLGLGYHNHDFEFATLPDGSRPIDHLFGEGVMAEVDIGWVARAGKNPAAEIDKLASQTIAFHIKDVAPVGTKVDDGWAPAGDGTIDWAALWPHIAKATKATVLVAEHDNPSDWKVMASRSFATIKKLVS